MIWRSTASNSETESTIRLMGGVGRVTGTALGALTTASVLSGLTLIGIEPNAQQIVVGALIALAIAVQGIGRANLRS